MIQIQNQQNQLPEVHGSAPQHFHQHAPAIESKVDKIRLTNDQIKQFNNLALQLNNGSIKMEEVTLQLRGGSDTLDEELIKSIVSKLSESGWNNLSINKMLQKLAEGSLEIATNSNLLRILAELEKPIAK